MKLGFIIFLTTVVLLSKIRANEEETPAESSEEVVPEEAENSEEVAPENAENTEEASNPAVEEESEDAAQNNSDEENNSEEASEEAESGMDFESSDSMYLIG